MKKPEIPYINTPNLAKIYQSTAIARLALGINILQIISTTTQNIHSQTKTTETILEIGKKVLHYSRRSSNQLTNVLKILLVTDRRLTGW